jgi:anaerobic magnesium-protoporphyrin IX monomethyl ester cyclase
MEDPEGVGNSESLEIKHAVSSAKLSTFRLYYDEHAIKRGSVMLGAMLRNKISRFFFKQRKKSRGIGDGVLVIGMPCWNVDYPFYSLMVVAGIAESIGIESVIADLNIRLFNLVPDEDKAYWTKEDANNWLPGGYIPPKLYSKHRKLVEKALIAAASERNYGVFLLSCNMSNRYFTEKAIVVLKKNFPDVPVLMGGVDCFPFEHNKRFFSLSVPPDVICQGEAEIALPQFLAAYSGSGELPTNIPGFAGYADGTFFDTGEPILPDLKKDFLLPSLSGIDFLSYRNPGDFPIYSSRGCINRCNFCSESPNFKKFRFRNAEQTFEELSKIYSEAVKFNINPTVHFADSLINGSIPELENLCRLILKSNILINWGGQAFFRKEMNRGLLSLMKKAGCRGLFWGLESGSQVVIDAMKKNYLLETARTIINECNAIGILNYLPLIVGFPGESTANFVETATFVEDFKDKAIFLEPNPCCVRPNSPLYEMYSQFGLKNNDYTEWQSIDMSNTPAIRKTRSAILKAILKNDLDGSASIDSKLEKYENGLCLDNEEVKNEISRYCELKKAANH